MNMIMDTFFLLSAQYLIFLEVAAAAIYFFMQPRDMRRSMVILSIVFLPSTYVVAKISSLFFYNPRPFVSDGIVPLLAHAADNGFPSDHALLAAAVAAIIFIYNKKFGVVLGIAALIVGTGRVFVGVHHWIDVLWSAGIAIMTMLVVKRYVVAHVERYVYKRFP